MTNEEAIEQLKIHKKEVFCDFGWNVSVLESIEMAIRSLEAWGKVKEEIKNAKPVYPDRVRIWGTDTILALIDKHLQEVENGRR